MSGTSVAFEDFKTGPQQSKS